MAVVRRFVEGERQVRNLQPTQVDCVYFSGEVDGRRILQLDTYGSKARQQPGSQSQTLQLSEDAARELWHLLGQKFGFK